MAGIFGLLLSGAVKVVDQFFEYTTLLLPGNGTNGAQNNTFLDGSTNNFTITRNGNTTQGTFSPFSQTGWGNYFDGSGDWLTFTGATTGSGDFTTEAWVYLATLKDFQIIFDNRATGGTATGYAFGVNAAGKPYIYTNSVYQILSSIVITANSWNHVALVRNGTTITIYVNGVSGGTYTSSANFSDTNNGIGIAPTFTSTSQYFGYISNLRIVNGTAVYTSAFTPPTAPLTAISGTSLLTCQSNRFIDNSSNNFTITRNGDTRVVAFSPFNPSASWSAATYGGSGYFDGSGDYLSAASNAAFNFGSGAFTIELWYYPTTLSGTQCLITNYGGSTTGFAVQMGGSTVGSGKIDVNLSGDGADITSTNAVQLNSWNHIAISGTPGATGIKLFINGNQEGSTYTGATSLDTSATLFIGEIASTNRLSGYLSGLRLLKGTAQYTAAFTPPTAPPTAITNTSLLLNFTNAGIYDATSKNDLETVGNAQISTAISAKWGSGSMYFDGNGDYLNFPALNLYALGSGDFTYEYWVYLNTLSGTPTFVDTRTTGASASGISDYKNVSNKVVIYFNSTDILTSTTSLTATQWTHIAVSRASGTLRIFINGVLDASTSNSTNFTDQTLLVGVNRNVTAGSIGSGFLNGYIQDLRITKGYARYTANFTPPTAAFPTL